MPNKSDTFKVVATQGQGEVVAREFKTLGEAKKYIEARTGDCSFGIRLPDGSLHRWKDARGTRG